MLRCLAHLQWQNRLTAEVQAQMGITESTVRLSVGLEHASDLIRDIEQALKKI